MTRPGWGRGRDGNGPGSDHVHLDGFTGVPGCKGVTEVCYALATEWRDLKLDGALRDWGSYVVVVWG